MFRRRFLAFLGLGLPWFLAPRPAAAAPAPTEIKGYLVDGPNSMYHFFRQGVGYLDCEDYQRGEHLSAKEAAEQNVRFWGKGSKMYVVRG